MADLDITLKRKTGASYDNLHPTTTWTQVESKPTTFTPTSHTHVSADITDLKSNLKFLYIYGKAQSAITKGQAVQFAGVQGDHILMKPAVPSEINANPDYFIGLAESTLATNDFGYILTQGELVNVNTSAYTAGNILWFASAGSTAGAITATEPTNSNARIQVASVNKVNATEGILFVRVNFVGTEIEDIVASGTPSSSTFLRGDGQWVAPSGSGTVTSVSSGTQISGMAMTITNGTSTPSIATSISNAANFRTAIGAGTGNGNVSTSGTITANTIPYWVNTTSIGTLATTTYPSLTELSYVKGVTSAIQTQINGIQFDPQRTQLFSATSSASDTTYTATTGNYSTYKMLYLEIDRGGIQKSGRHFRISDIGDGVGGSGPWHTLMSTSTTNGTSVVMMSISRASSSGTGNTFRVRTSGLGTSYTIRLFSLGNID
jgi:hypothetical protein